MLKEFREFIAKGNVLDLAIGIVIGAAFGKIVTSFVQDVLMPPIGLLLGKVDFANLYISLTGQTFASYADAKKAGAPVIGYGTFVSTILDFVIVAFAIFLVVKGVNKMRREAPEAAPETKPCPFCCSAIAVAATRCPQCTSQIGV